VIGVVFTLRGLGATFVAGGVIAVLMVGVVAAWLK